MSASKTFSTLAVASAATGIGLADGMNYSTMAEISSHVLGFDIWTHELADRAMNNRVRDRLLTLFPGLPTGDEARADWRAAAAKAVAAYGDTLTIPAGADERSESPIESLARMVGDKPIVAVVAPSPEPQKRT